MKNFARIFTLLICLVPLSACGAKKKSYPERVAEIKADKKLSDEQAIEHFAIAGFSFAEVATTAKGKAIAVELTFRGFDESIASSASFTPAGGWSDSFQSIQIYDMMCDLDDFIPLAKERGMDSLVVTMKTPTYTGKQIDEWVDTYKFRLNAKQFQPYLNSKTLNLEKRVKAAPSLWKVELNRFKEFTYEKKSS